MRTLPPIPCVDVAPLVAGDSDAPARRSAAVLRAACARVGFVTVRGHGVPDDVTRRMREAAREFFALPAARKLRAAPRRWNPGSPNEYRGYFPSRVHGKEGLDLGDPRVADAALPRIGRPFTEAVQLPEELGAAWRRAVEDHYGACFRLGRTLLRSLVGSLGGRPELVDAAFARPRSLSTLRLNRYPADAAPVEVSAEDGAELACETHVDSGVLTLLPHDPRGGLEVRDVDDRWQEVPSAPDAFVVNTGLVLERLTGGRLPATAHRVRAHNGERLSLPFFLEPAHDFRIAPESLGLAGNGAAAASACDDYAAFLRASLTRFAEYRRDGEEPQGGSEDRTRHPPPSIAG